ncbi:MAG TPA: hypothetical protein PLM63_00905 [bacterium]|nr:hypothetical protein [bacterium]
MTNNKSIIAENIKKDCKKKIIAHGKLSKLMNIIYNTIIKIKSGVTYNPKIKQIKQIANVLGIGIK